jgi:AraC family transcriptional regulator of adaptative response / DNA-3-methyladenine glycosylase II
MNGELDLQACHAAADARDRRADGRFFIGVTSTGIYCRCVCPARLTKRQNRRFFASAAAAENQGFRPCLRCRPECAPGAAPIDAADRLAHLAVKRIEAGALEERGLDALAAELGVTDRHLRRVVFRTFGASPVDLAQTHRLLTAKRLLKDTRLPMTEVAFAAGFQSLRRFNALFRERYAMAPSRVRARTTAAVRDGALSFALAARGSFDGAAPLAHLQQRRVAGLEAQTGPAAWTRSFAIGEHAGWLTLELGGPTPSLTLSEGLMPVFRQVLAAARAALDLDTDVEVIDAFFAGRHLDAPPGLRLPGALDPFELTVRAILGQQVTVRAASTLAARLTARFGAPLQTPVEGVDRLFPTPARLAEAGAAALAALGGQPRARAETVHRLAVAVARGQLTLVRGAVAAGRAGLGAIAGIGPWTVEYVALRALGDADAFPLGDSALRSAYDGDLRAAHARWRPWRAYAATRLWHRTATRPRGEARP